MDSNWVRCANYDGRPLVPPNHLQFGILSNKQRQCDKLSKQNVSEKRKREDDEGMTKEEELSREVKRLQDELDKERERSSQLEDELVVDKLTVQLYN